MARPKINLSGLRFGRLYVVCRANPPKGKHSKILYICKCDCGNTTTVRNHHLTGGKIRSCGCLRINRKDLNKQSRSAEYIMYYSARKRAQERGWEIDFKPEDITIPEICPLLDIPLFRRKGNKTANSPSLDRFDPAKGYTKDNIWVISNKANAVKSDLSVEQLEEFVRRLKIKRGEIPLKKAAA